MARVRLIIPYVSQLVPKTETNFAQGDCGPACLTAVIRAKTGRHIAVDDVSRTVRPSGNFEYTTVRELANAAPKYGVALSVQSRITKAQLEQQLTARKSVILLVYYPSLPAALKYDPRYSYNHFITVHGMDDANFYYDDPFFPDNRGENKTIAKDSLIYAANKVVEATPGLGLFTNVVLPVIANTPKDGGTIPPASGFTLEGVVQDAAGRPLANVGVRLMAKRDLLIHVAGASVAPQHGSVSWSKIRSNVDDTRWNYFEQQVQNKLGLSWNEFNNELLRLNPALKESQKFMNGVEYKLPELANAVSWTRPVLPDGNYTRDEAYVRYVAPTVIGQFRTDFYTEVVAYNPSLKAQGNAPRLLPNVTYRFPENVWGVDVEWSRKVTGLRIPVNHRSGLFEAEIRGKVLGLTHDQFIAEFTTRNPIVKQDNGLILPEREYLLPTNVPAEMCYLSAWTGADGKYRFTGLKEGRYIVTASGAGYEPYSDTLLASANKSMKVVLTAAEGDERGLEAKGLDADGVAIPAQITQLPAYVYTDGQHLRRADAPFRFVGVNMPGLLHYGHTNDPALSKSDRDTQLVQMTTARENGASVLRVRLAHRSVSTEEVIARLESVLEVAAALNLSVIATFVDGNDARGFYVKGDGNYYRATPDNDEKGDPASAGFFANGYQKHYLPFVQRIVRHFRDNATLLAWELGNNFTPPDADTFIDFAHTVATAIQDYDPFHLILPGIAGIQEAGLNEAEASRLYNHPAIHAVTVGASGETPLADGRLAQSLKRPLLVLEGSAGTEGGTALTLAATLETWFSVHKVSGFVVAGFTATDAARADSHHPEGLSFDNDDWDEARRVLQAWGADLA